jgi:hypothetical protein
VLGQRLCRRERVESGGPHVYVRQTKASGFAWLSGGLGGFSKGVQDLNRAIGFVRAFGGSGSGWEMRRAREQASGAQTEALFTGGTL